MVEKYETNDSRVRCQGEDCEEIFREMMDRSSMWWARPRFTIKTSKRPSSNNVGIR